MSKIMYFGIPAHGHTNPTLPVVKTLIARGHQVLYYNAEFFREKVAPTGVSYRAYPEPMPTEREVTEALHGLIDASLILSRMGEKLVPFVLAEVEREQPDLILYDSTAWWGYLAARTHQVKHICLFTHFLLDGSLGMIGWGVMARFFAGALRHIPELLGWRRRMAERYGKTNAGGITEYGDLNLIFTSDYFHPENRMIDSRFRGSRFRLVGPSLDTSLRQEQPLPLPVTGNVIYLSLGTINHLDLAFYRAAFDAFGSYPAQFVLAAGKQTSLDFLGTIPANFIVRNSVPQLEVLRRADAFITHGGMNSVHEGLYNGVPLVVVPHQLEQLLNGKRVAQMGAGLLLGSRPPYGQVTAGELRHALDTILTDSGYRERAAEIGETLKSAGGYLRAADEIEALLGQAERVIV